MVKAEQDIVGQILDRLANKKPRIPSWVPKSKQVPVGEPTQVPEGVVTDQVLKRLKKQKESSTRS